MENAYVFKMFLAGKNDKAQAVYDKLNSTLQELPLPGYELEVIDVLENPQIAQEFDIFATPTLVKISPGPAYRVVGKLDDPHKVCEAMGLIQ